MAVDVLAAPVIAALVLIIPKKRRLLIWGTTPIISNKYWSRALTKAGFQSQTLMPEHYPVYRKEDFDLYFADVTPRFIWPPPLRRALQPLFAFLYIIRNASVVHLPFSGGPLGNTYLWRLEAHLWRWAGIRTVLMPYGGDVYVYSRVIDPSVRNGLLSSYPQAARVERKIAQRVEYWTRRADVMLTGFMVDGTARWDCALFYMVVIDTAEWVPKPAYSLHDGRNGRVKVMHTPNHRGFKGTEYLVQAVDELKREGLDIELVLLENVPNAQVRELMQGADILAEQFIIGYAMSAIEGMASGLPVMSNLENEAYTRVFRRYSYLNECPILSTSPENIKENLRILVTRPELRRQLGQAGRKYVEKYHSEETARYLFGSIYDKILHGKEVDLMNLFHPLKAEYNRRKPLIDHPLCENKLPKTGPNAEKIS